MRLVQHQRPLFFVGLVLTAALVCLTWQVGWADEFSGLSDPRLASTGNAAYPSADATVSSVSSQRYGVVPGSPTAPQPTTRPAHWPGAAASTGGGVEMARLPAVGSAYPNVAKGRGSDVDFLLEGKIEPCEEAQILARVGTEVILKSDILAVLANEMVGKVEKFPEEYRRQATQQLLPMVIENKLIYLDAKRAIPPEGLTQMDEQLSKHFTEEEISRLMKKANAKNRKELEEKFQAMGSSLENQKHLFKERALSQQWVAMNVKPNEPVEHDELLKYYYDHLEEYKNPTRARWQQLTVRFSRFPSKAEAYARIAELGNQIQGGVAFDEVAKNHSHGITAAKGGKRDWTSPGGLRSKEIDRNLFALPVGSLSPILTDESGFHIIKILERKEAHTTPLAEVQAEIKKQIQDKRFADRFDEYREKLKRETLVWTIFDDGSGNSAAKTAQRENGRKVQ